MARNLPPVAFGRNTMIRSIAALCTVALAGYCFIEPAAPSHSRRGVAPPASSLRSSSLRSRLASDASGTRHSATTPETSQGEEETSGSQSTWLRVLSGVALGLMVAVSAVGSPDAALADAPGKWNYLNSDKKWPKGFGACSGKEQSPIDIKVAQGGGASTNVLYRGRPDPLANYIDWYPIKDLQVLNNGGKNIQVNGGFGTFTLPDGVYEAKQFHFHFPSEHTINGKLYAGELHVVHQRRGASGTNGLAVVGIILDEQAPKDQGQLDFLYNLGFGKELPEEPGQKYNIAPVDLTKYMSNYQGGYFHYEGSLTTPPCSEKVHWYVLEKTAPCTPQMTKSFKELFPENNRPVQGVNRRKIIKSLNYLPGEFVDPSKPQPPGFIKKRI